MAQETLTFEAVNDHIEKANLDALSQPTETAQNQICAIYAVVRPILKLISSLPLIPEKWKKAIQLFIQLMDAFCPQT